MKLIDLLVQELPKKLGWPEGAIQITQDEEGEICCWKKSGAECVEGCWKHPDGDGLWLYMCNDDAIRRADDRESSIITREQYEAALAAPNQPAWDGEGLPPVGIECEWLASGDHDWMRVKVLAYHEDEVWLQPLNGAQSFTVGNPDDFRPMRSEAERKRDKFLSYCNGKPVNTYAELYDDIADGKIHGVKLEADHE